MKRRCSGALTDWQFIAWLPAFGLTASGLSIILFSYFPCNKTTSDIIMPHPTSTNHKVIMRSLLSQVDLHLSKRNVRFLMSYLRKTYPRKLANISFEKKRNIAL